MLTWCGTKYGCSLFVNSKPHYFEVFNAVLMSSDQRGSAVTHKSQNHRNSHVRYNSINVSCQMTTDEILHPHMKRDNKTRSSEKT